MDYFISLYGVSGYRKGSDAGMPPLTLMK